MRTIRISDEVWEALAGKGKFGETPDDVLRRVFRLGEDTGRKPGPRGRYATRRMSAKVDDQELFVGFAGGPSKAWSLPQRNEKLEIRKVRNAAVTFAEENSATLGQVNAVKKALTDSGYPLTK